MAAKYLVNDGKNGLIFWERRCAAAPPGKLHCFGRPKAWRNAKDPQRGACAPLI
jgi:hypothetical protein